MHPVSQSRIGQILSPTGQAATPSPAASPSRVTLEQIVHPRADGSPYAGPERRAQGYLIAEPLPGAPAVDSPPAGPGQQR